MALPDYPSTLPYKPQRDGFARPQHHTPLLVTEVEDGPALTRVQSQTRIKKLSYRLIFSDSEYATWEDFVENDLGQGSGKFMMSVPVVGSTYSTRRVYIEGGQWSDEPLDGYWAVTFTLCVFPAA